MALTARSLPHVHFPNTFSPSAIFFKNASISSGIAGFGSEVFFSLYGGNDLATAVRTSESNCSRQDRTYASQSGFTKMTRANSFVSNPHASASEIPPSLISRSKDQRG